MHSSHKEWYTVGLR